MELGLELAIVVVLVLLNGLFAMAELAMMTARKPRLQSAAEQGDGKARLVLKLLQHPDRLLSTVQVGITLVGAFASAFAGVTLADRLAGQLVPLGLTEAVAQAISVGVVVVSISYLSLVFGELVPKQLALRAPERIAGQVAGLMHALAGIARPAVLFLSASTRLVLLAMGIRNADDEGVTEEDVKLHIREGGRSGALHKIEHEILERVVSLDERKARDLMTTRVEIDWLDVTKPWPENAKLIQDTRHGQFPVCEGDLDDVVGMVSLNSLWLARESGEPDLRALATAPLYVPTNVTALRLLENLKLSRSSAALVIDEHGSVEGMITLNDLLEALVGDVASISEDESLVVRRDDGSLLVDGLLPAGDFAEELGFVPSDRGDYATLAGFVMHELGRIPEPGDWVVRDGYRFEVMDLDGRRIDKVLVSQEPSDDESA